MLICSKQDVTLLCSVKAFIKDSYACKVKYQAFIQQTNNLYRIDITNLKQLILVVSVGTDNQADILEVFYKITAVIKKIMAHI